MSDSLKLVILFDAKNNMYTVCDHNLSPEEAETRLAELRSDQLPALTVNQRARHKTPNAEACRACRNDIVRSAGLEPKPKFKRRKP